MNATRPRTLLRQRYLRFGPRLPSSGPRVAALRLLSGHEIGRNVRIGRRALLAADRFKVADGCVVGGGTVIRVDCMIMEPGSCIGHDVRIRGPLEMVIGAC